MRKLKFRGKDIETGEWVYGDFHRCGEYCKNTCVMVKNFDASEFDNLITVYTNTISQYTGFEDTNGKEIYEKDHVEISVNKKVLMEK